MRYLVNNLSCKNCINSIIEGLSQTSGILSINRGKFLELELLDKDSNLEEVEGEIKKAISKNNHLHDVELKDLYVNDFKIQGLNCPHCAGAIIKRLKREDDIFEADYNLNTRILNIESIDSNRSQLKTRVQNIIDAIEDGVKIVDDKKECRHCHISSHVHKKPIVNSHKYHHHNHEDVHGHEHSHSHGHSHEHGELLSSDIIKYGFVLLSLIALHFVKIKSPYDVFIYLGLYLLVGYKVLKTIFKGSLLDENFLMSIASIAAIYTGNYSEAVAVMLFYCIGEMFEDYAVEKSRNSITKALELKPEFANLKIGPEIKKVKPEEVKVGDVVVVKPGEKFALDGKIIKGSTQVDTSNITGESLPQQASIGDMIHSGCINLNGLVEMEVTASYKSGTIAKILEMVQNAGQKKAPVEKFITKFAKYYTPTVVALAVLMTLIMPFITAYDFKFWLYRACVFLVISCPCALVISVPLGIFAGIGALSKSAVFVKGGNYIQALSDIDTICFDKTGTVTKGEFEITKIKNIDAQESEILKYAATAEKNSTHPIALAISKNSDEVYENFVDLVEISGKGMSYRLGEDKILVGNRRLMQEEEVDLKETEARDAIEVYVAKNKKLLGIIELKDQLRPESKSEIKELKSMGIQTVMLSGDKTEVVEKVAEELDIDISYGSLMPVDKVKIIEDIMNKMGKKVAFVGDGTNDAPVLARADVGIAMGSRGSDIAVEAADIVLLKDEIKKVVDAIKISKKIKRIVYENIAIALGLKLIILVLGLMGIASMWLAVFADVGVTLIAILNSMRALSFRG